MGRACPHCHGTGVAPAPNPAALLDHLRATVAERQIWLSPDGMVREADAAALIGQAAKTLQNWRYGDARLPFTKRKGRPLYALADLADYLAS